jgi:hypothetical protein
MHKFMENKFKKEKMKDNINEVSDKLINKKEK